jgi:hypothetical protein
MAAAARYSQMAFVIPAAVVIGYYGGRWLDGRMGTHWISTAGVILGACAGLFNVVATLMKDPGNGT